MRRVLFTLMSIGCSFAAVLALAGTVYKWVDQNGVVHYSDQPHANAQKIQVQQAQTYKATQPGASTAAPTAPAVPASAALLKAYRAGDIMRAQEIQRRLNRCFPRGGEEALGHLGVTKVTASVSTGIDMGPARPPYMAPEDAAERLRKRLPQLQEIL